MASFPSNGRYRAAQLGKRDPLSGQDKAVSFRKMLEKGWNFAF